jgi:hypothetical protein
MNLTKIIPLLVVCPLLAPALAAQQVPNRAAASGGLEIVVLQGLNAKHNTVNKTATQTVVEVRDQNKSTVPNVRVTFKLPASGPGGAFPGGRNVYTTVTNYQGQAATMGFVPNDIEGGFNLEVIAETGSRSAAVTVAQINSSKAEPVVEFRRKSRKTLWAIIAAGAAGGVAAGVLSSRAGTSTPPSVLIARPGAVTVGGPR